MTDEIAVRAHRGFQIAVFEERRGYVAYVIKIGAKHRGGRSGMRFGPHRSHEQVLEAAISAIDVGFVR